MADQAIDYAALATNAGAVPATPDVGPVQPATVDYAALAKQAGAVASTAAPGPSAGTWEDRGIGGKVWHPASGATERGREDNSLFGMPPEFAALSGLAIARAIGAPALTVAARAVAGIQAAAGQALPAVKYEVTKTALEKVGIPTPLAVAAAMAVSGYKRGGKAEAAAIEEGHVSAPGYPRETVTPAPVVTPPPPAPAAAAAVPPTEFQAAQAARQANTLPDQAALNAEAIARRRAAYQASQASAPAAAEPVVAASGPMKLTAPEFKEFQRLVAKKVPPADALEQVKAMRELATRFGLSQPTAAETRFPKGARR